MPARSQAEVERDLADGVRGVQISGQRTQSSGQRVSCTGSGSGAARSQSVCRDAVGSTCSPQDKVPQEKSDLAADRESERLSALLQCHCTCDTACGEAALAPEELTRLDSFWADLHTRLPQQACFDNLKRLLTLPALSVDGKNPGRDVSPGGEQPLPEGTTAAFTTMCTTVGRVAWGELLDAELWVLILSASALQSVGRLAASCRRLNDCATDTRVWKELSGSRAQWTNLPLPRAEAARTFCEEASHSEKLWHTQAMCQRHPHPRPLPLPSVKQHANVPAVLSVLLLATRPAYFA